MTQTFPTLTYEIAFTGDVDDPTTWVWTNVTPYVMAKEGWHTERGGEYLLGRSQPGLLQIAVDNRTGRFDPGNTSSPYWPNVLPLRPIRISGTVGGTYRVWTGYVERWPTTWTRNGRFGLTRIRAIDAFGRLTGTKLKQALETEVRADGPIWFYPLDEAVGSRSAGDRINPAVNPPLVRTNSKYGGQTCTFGTEMLVDGTGVYFDSPTAGESTTGPLTVLRARPGPGGAGLVPTSGGFSVECFVRMATRPSYTTMLWGQFSDDANVVCAFYVQPNGQPYFTIGDAPGSFASRGSSIDICDNQVHHLFATVSGDYQTVSLVVDDVDMGAALGSVIDLSRLTTMLVGGQVLANGESRNGLDGTIAGIALYPGVKSASRGIAHYHAGHDGFEGEDTGARASRILSYAGWHSSLKSHETGLSLSGPLISAGRNVLELLQETNNSESGRLFVSGSGVITTKSRGDVYDRTAPGTVLGDGPGELPFEPDLEVEFDPDRVVNDAQITRALGATITIQDQASIDKYGVKTLTATVNLYNDLQAADAAGFYVSEGAEPRQRISSLRINAAGNPDGWPTVLSLEIGMKVRVIRRTPAGQLMQLDCVIDNIAHDAEPPNAWEVTLQLVPATTRNTYWVLGDATYGVLDSTTRLGY